MKEGNAIKVTSSQTKAIVKQNLGRVKVGQLGPILDVLHEESPSILVNVIGKGNFMKELKELKLKIHLWKVRCKNSYREMKPWI